MITKIIHIIIAVAVAALLLGLLIGRRTRNQIPATIVKEVEFEVSTPKAAQAVTQRTSLSGKVYNLIILDESGSMESIWKPALNGANETIQTIKSTQSEHPEQKQFLTFVSFSNKGGKPFRVLIDNKPVDEVQELTEQDYRPNGNTPLWDAIGYSLTKLEQEVTDQDLVLVAIITDGYENASCEYNGKAIKDLIERLTAKDWVFAYIGANQDAIEIAGEMGIRNALHFDSDADGTKEMWRKERKCREVYYFKMRSGEDKESLKDNYFAED